MKDFGPIIAKIRNEKGLSQEEFASLLGVTKQTISNYERGKRRPDYEVLEAIADVLNVPMGYFLTEEEQAKKLKTIYRTYKIGSAAYHENIERFCLEKIAEAEIKQLSPTALDVARAYDQMSEYGKSMIDKIIENEKAYKVVKAVPVVEMGDPSKLMVDYLHTNRQKEIDQMVENYENQLEAAFDMLKNEE